MRPGETSMGGANRAFRTTIWGDILAAGDPSNPRAREHLARLLQAYWKPVYVYVRHVWGAPVEDSKDLTQAFFAKFLEKETWSRVQPGRGSFRAYLKAALRHFLINAKEFEDVRRPISAIVSIEGTEDLETRLPSTRDSDPDRLYDREWLRCLMSDATAELKTLLDAQGKPLYWRVFEAYSRPDAGSEPTYKDVALHLGLQESDVRNYLSAARRLLQEILRRRVRDCVASEDDVEQELGDILKL